MGIFDKLSDWFEAPYVTLYRCSDCGARFATAGPTCPECGEEMEASETAEISDYYWGPM